VTVTLKVTVTWVSCLSPAPDRPVLAVFDGKDPNPQRGKSGFLWYSSLCLARDGLARRGWESAGEV